MGHRSVGHRRRRTGVSCPQLRTVLGSIVEDSPRCSRARRPSSERASCLPGSAVGTARWHRHEPAALLGPRPTPARESPAQPHAARRSATDRPRSVGERRRRQVAGTEHELPGRAPHRDPARDHGVPTIVGEERRVGVDADERAPTADDALIAETISSGISSKVGNDVHAGPQPETRCVGATRKSFALDHGTGAATGEHPTALDDLRDRPPGTAPDERVEQVGRLATGRVDQIDRRAPVGALRILRRVAVHRPARTRQRRRG